MQYYSTHPTPTAMGLTNRKAQDYRSAARSKAGDRAKRFPAGLKWNYMTSFRFTRSIGLRRR